MWHPFAKAREVERPASPIRARSAFTRVSDKILALLQVRGPVGGLEVSDMSLRLAYGIREFWAVGVRLPPGILVDGEVRNRTSFVEALRTLRLRALGSRRSARRINATVAFDSSTVYSRVFNLPLLSGVGLEQAVALNIQAISPYEEGRAYVGWQVVGEELERGRLDILASFANRAYVDALESALEEAGFVVIAIEPRALSLTRLVRRCARVPDGGAAYLLAHADVNGLELVVVRHGSLYFDYPVSWRDLQGDAPRVDAARFASEVRQRIHQVLNFYMTHWARDPIRGVFISAGENARETLADAVRGALPEGLEVKTLEVPPGVASPWYAALGAGVRGTTPRREDKELSVASVSARDVFLREQLRAFLRFWRVLVPATLGFLVAVGVLAYALLAKAHSLAARTSGGGAVGASREAGELALQAKEFNSFVGFLNEARAVRDFKTPFIERVLEIVRSNQVTIRRLSFQGVGVPLTLAGEALSEDRLLVFKRALEREPGIRNVTLSLNDLKASAQGISFSISFERISPNTK